MEPKKHPSKDVHRYSVHFFLSGLCISITMLIMAFQWSVKIKNRPPFDLSLETANFYDVVPLFLPEIPSGPIPPRKIPIISPQQIAESIADVPEKKDAPLAVELPEGNIACHSAIQVPEEIPIDTFIFVANKPSPVGGYSNFYKQVSKAIKYPNIAKQRATEGKVFVEFVVNHIGEPVNFNIIKGIGSGCDEEAIRVLSLTRWEPGKQRGRPVHVRMVIPITFKLN